MYTDGVKGWVRRARGLEELLEALELLDELLEELSATSSRGRLAERAVAGETGEVERSCMARNLAVGRWPIVSNKARISLMGGAAGQPALAQSPRRSLPQNPKDCPL